MTPGGDFAGWGEMGAKARLSLGLKVEGQGSLVLSTVEIHICCLHGYLHKFVAPSKPTASLLTLHLSRCRLVKTTVVGAVAEGGTAEYRLRTFS